MYHLILHLQGGGKELLVNAEHVSAVTHDTYGARLHMHVTTGLSWGVTESYDEVKRMLTRVADDVRVAEARPGTTTTPPPPLNDERDPLEGHGWPP